MCQILWTLDEIWPSDSKKKKCDFWLQNSRNGSNKISSFALYGASGMVSTYCLSSQLIEILRNSHPIYFFLGGWGCLTFNTMKFFKWQIQKKKGSWRIEPRYTCVPSFKSIGPRMKEWLWVVHYWYEKYKMKNNNKNMFLLQET